MWIIRLFHNSRTLTLILSATLLLGLVPSSSGAFSITFEGLLADPAEPVLTDGETVTYQYDYLHQGAIFGGASFSGAYAAVSGAVGGSLNQIDFPPVSGDTVLANDPLDGFTPSSNVMTVKFDTLLQELSGYFVYSDTDFAGSNSLSISAYSSPTGGALVDQFSLSENLGSPQFVRLSGLQSIGFLRIEGEPESYFTLDDLAGIAAGGASGNSVPEPDTLWLMIGGLAVLFRSRKSVRPF